MYTFLFRENLFLRWKYDSLITYVDAWELGREDDVVLYLLLTLHKSADKLASVVK